MPLPRTGSGSPVTVGVDIGTTSVKAVAVDEDGTIVNRCRIPHDLVVAAADRLEHRPDQAWRANVRTAVSDVSVALDVAAVNVAAMVPSMCAVDERGRSLTPGLLYGDGRGRSAGAGDPSQGQEAAGFVRWLIREAPDATGLWPAQAMANHALCGEGVLDTTTAMTTGTLLDRSGWNAEVVADAGATVSLLPRLVPGHQAIGHVDEDLVPGRPALGGGTIDAFAEQLVAGAGRSGDVLVILGATLISWAVIDSWREVEGLWTVPHHVPGLSMLGGPSNAGGLFVDWVRRIAGDASPPDQPDRVPVWTPYPRGERVPLHDPDRRAGLHDLDLTHSGGAIVRAAHEAAGFVIRHQLELAGLRPHRIVATGGGTRSVEWLQAIADSTGLPVDVAAVPEGAALGSAFLARIVAGLEDDVRDANRWVRTGRRVEPDPAWVGPVSERYVRFRAETALG